MPVISPAREFRETIWGRHIWDPIRRALLHARYPDWVSRRDAYCSTSGGVRRGATRRSPMPGRRFRRLPQCVQINHSGPASLSALGSHAGPIGFPDMKEILMSAEILAGQIALYLQR